MATLVYNKARKLFATAAINWPALGSVKAALLNGNYTPNPASHQFMSDISAGNILVRSGSATGLGVSNNGVVQAVLPTFVALSTAGVPVTSIVLYIDTGVDATSTLIYYSSDVIGFPFVPVGANYAVLSDQNAGGWFQV